MGLLEWFNRPGIKGQPYAFGGPAGRTDFGDTAHGFDCSGFVAWVFYKASGGSVKLPAYTDAIAHAPGVHPLPAGTAPQPGDIILYKYSDSSQPGVQYPHTAIYAGNGLAIQSTVSSGVSIRPVGIAPNPTYFRVDGAPPFSDTATAPTPATPVTSPSAPITTPLQPPPGVSNPNPNPQHPIGSAPGGSGGGSTSSAGGNAQDWVQIDLGPLGKHQIPTARGVVDMLASSIKNAVQSSWETWGIPAAFYTLGAVVLVVGLVGLAMQALDAGAASAQAQSSRPSVKLAKAVVAA